MSRDKIIAYGACSYLVQYITNEGMNCQRPVPAQHLHSQQERSTLVRDVEVYSTAMSSNKSCFALRKCIEQRDHLCASIPVIHLYILFRCTGQTQVNNAGTIINSW